MPSRITQQSYRPRVSNRIMGWQLSFSQRFELAQLRELTASNAHRVMKQAWDQLELDSSLCGAHKVNSKPIVDRNGAWMQSAKLPHLAREGKIFLLTSLFIGSPYRKRLGKNQLASRTLGADALVDRILRFFIKLITAGDGLTGLTVIDGGLPTAVVGGLLGLAGGLLGAAARVDRFPKAKTHSPESLR